MVGSHGMFTHELQKSALPFVSQSAAECWVAVRGTSRVGGVIDSGLVGCDTRQENAKRSPTQSRISPSIERILGVKVSLMGCKVEGQRVGELKTAARSRVQAALGPWKARQFSIKNNSFSAGNGCFTAQGESTSNAID